jgi:hypothetical protein
MRYQAAPHPEKIDSSVQSSRIRCFRGFGLICDREMPLSQEEMAVREMAICSAISSMVRLSSIRIWTASVQIIGVGTDPARTSAEMPAEGR